MQPIMAIDVICRTLTLVLEVNFYRRRHPRATLRTLATFRRQRTAAVRRLILTLSPNCDP